MDVMPRVMTHSEPAWRGEANFVITARVETESGQHWESLAAKEIADREFIVCCIPFLVDGLALGDRVATVPSGDKRFVVQRIVQRSGHRTVRVWFGKTGDDQAKKSVSRCASEHGCVIEWSSRNFLVISSDDEARLDSVAEHLQAQGGLGLLRWEFGNS